jgi:hypothetical protein
MLIRTSRVVGHEENVTVIADLLRLTGNGLAECNRVPVGKLPFRGPLGRAEVVSGQPTRLAFVSPHAQIVPARYIYAGPLRFVSAAVLLLPQRLGEAESSEVFVWRVIDYGHSLTAWEGGSVAGYRILDPGIEVRLENVGILPALRRWV